MARLSQDDLKRMLPEKRKAYIIRERKVRRNRRILAVSITLFLTLTAVIVLSLKVFFKIDTIKVLGDSIYEESQIISVSGLEKGDNLFLSNAVTAKQNIEKNFPYLSSVQVKREFPSTIIIEVTGTRASCCFKTVSGTALADETLKVLEIKKEGDDGVSGLISFVTKSVLSAEAGVNLLDSNAGKDTPKETAQEAELIKNVYDGIIESGIEDITEVNVVSPGNIIIVYQDRLRLNIGSTDKLTYKLKSAVQIIKQEDEINPSEKGEIFLNDTKNIYVSPEKK